MRLSCCGGGSDWRVIVGLPSDLTELAKDYSDLVDDHKSDQKNAHDAIEVEKRAYQEVIQKHAELQDCCPGLFAHHSEGDAMRVIEQLDLLNGRGLPKRY